jgi:hypothetical protein
MDLKNIVANNTVESLEGGLVVNVNTLSNDQEFHEHVVNAIVKKAKQNRRLCVWFPAYEFGKYKGNLNNKLAQELALKAFVAGEVVNIKTVHHKIDEVLIVKQVFKTGESLKRQIAQLKEGGYKVSVLTAVAHSGARVEGFAYENQVELKALVCLDEIRHLI